MIVDILLLAVVVAAVAGAYLYPFVSGMVLMAHSLKGIRERARALGYGYKRFYKNIFLVRNRAQRYDLMIYDKEKIYAVKLWSSYFIRSRLVVTERGGVFEQRQTMPVFCTEQNGGSPRIMSSRIVGVPRTKEIKNKTGRQLQNVLLIYPSYREMVVRAGKKEVAIESGDSLFDKVVYSPSAFLKVLEENSITALKSGARA